MEKADDTAEIEKNIVAVQDAINSCEAELRGCYADISKNVRNSLREITEAIDADFFKYTERAVSELNTFDNFEDINEYLRGIDDSYNRRTKNLLEKYDAKMRDKIIEQVVANYHNYAARIQESIGELEGCLQISINLNAKEAKEKEYVFNSGLTSMEQQEYEVRQRLEILRSQENELKENNLAAQANMRKQKQTEQKLRELEEQISEINQRIMPAIIHSTKKEEKQVDSGGVFGAIREFFAGKKTRMVEVTVTEDTAYREESAKRHNDLEDLKQERIRLAKALDDSVENNLLIANERYVSLQAKLTEAERQYSELVREHKEKFQNKYNAQIKRACFDLRNELCDKTEEIVSEIKKLLRKQEDKYAGIVSSVIMANLKQNLAHEQKKQETLLARLNSSENERDLRVTALSERLRDLERILEKAYTLQKELEDLKVD